VTKARRNKDVPELNNNRGNNRRRGRGNNNNNNGSRPQNGGQQINRIDSRARGNAPQMLEKYRKLAQDAHLNGDRVQAEYYLQFADHYFRVTADTRVRQEEARLRQNGGQPYSPAMSAGGSVSGDRWQDQDGEDDSMEFGVDSDFPTFDRAPPQPRREDREPREQRDPQRDYREPREPREQRQRAPEPVVSETIPPEGLRAAEGEPITPIVDNPFIRDARGPRGRNNDRRGGRRPDGDAPRPQRNFADAATEPAEPAPRFDPASLPPAIGIRSEPVPEAPAPAPVRAERPRTLRAATAATAPVAAAAPAEAPAATVAAPVETAETPVAAPRKRGRPRKNPLPDVQPASEG
jgi:hypothetical protein